MLAGTFSALAAGTALEATGVSQSKLFTVSKQPAPKPIAPKPIPPKPAPPKPAPPKKIVVPPKPSPKPPPKPKPKPKTPSNNQVKAVPELFSGGDSSSPDSATSAAAAVKSAPIDTVVFVDESFSSELITDLLFEDIAGQEILSIARNDTVNGQSVIYQPIKNLGIIRDTYNANNLLKLQETSDRFFANFIIDLAEKIPKVGNGANGANYYLDLTTGDGVIELINMRSDEQVEIQIANAGTIEDVGI